MNVHVSSGSAVNGPMGFLRNGGQMGAAMRAYDWSATPLGRPEGWPPSLRTCIRIMLASRQPMWVWWGRDLINLYNDAYLPIIGGKHPSALGMPAQQVWAEIWDQIKDRIAAAMAGEACYSEAELLVMNRNGYGEGTYYTFSFSPVPREDGSIGGIVCATTDDTDRVVSARRLALLRETASRTWEADTVDDVYRLAARALASDPRDMPFALLYRFAGADTAILAGAAGLEAGHPAAPPRLGPEDAPDWRVNGTGPRMVRLNETCRALPHGPWAAPPDEAMILPLSTSADAAPHGVLVLGVNPHRRRGEDGFETFAALLARQIASAIAGMESREMERERARSADSLALEIEHRRRIEGHQNALLDELNHRVKNTLATVQAMAMQTLKGVDRPARDAFIARLFALSSQHDLLTLDSWEGASFEGVVRRALRPWREEERVRFTVDGPPVHLDPKRALALGMGFHELATNAAAYGALSNETGVVRVSWTLDADGKRLKLRWQEEGGPPVTAPARKGFGLRLVEHGLGRELSGVVSLDFAPGGLVCEWVMKLP